MTTNKTEKERNSIDTQKWLADVGEGGKPDCLQDAVALSNEEVKTMHLVTTDIDQQGMMERILNGMDALITVCDPETFEILFLNDAIRDYFGIKDSSVGKLCYQILQKREAPCIGCPYQQLLDEPEQILHWEHREFVKGNILQKTARLIDWPGGKKAHLEYAVDVTLLVHTEEKLEQRGRMLDALNGASKIFLTQSEETFTDTMSEGFSSIADISNIDRMSVSRNTAKPDGLYATQIYRWSKEAGASVTPLDALQDTPYANSILRWEEVFRSDGCINGPVCQMPEADLLMRLGCVSVLAVPVFEKGIFWGFVLFEDLTHERVFSDDEVDILRSAGFMLVNAITRHERDEKIKATDEYTKLMLDATPLSCILWDATYHAIDCNTKAVALHGFYTKEECIARVRDSLPVYQPDGSLSVEKAMFYLNRAFSEGLCHFDWTLITLSGELIPTEVTLTRVKYGTGYMVAGYAIDLRDRTLLMSEITHQNVLLHAVNRLSSIMLSSKTHTFDHDILRSMKIIAEAVHVDRVCLYKNHETDGMFSYTPFLEWPDGGCSAEIGMTRPVSIDEHWYYRLSKNECISGIIKELPSSLRERLMARCVKSVIIVPVFLYGTFWGFVGFEDRKTERLFLENEENILRATGELIAEALVRHNMEENLRDSSIHLQHALAEAKAANSAKSEFLSSMSHEMRTPLNAVIGMTTIGKRADTKERKNYALNKIEEASTHLLGVINDILDMSKIEAGKLALSPIEFNMEQMLEKIIPVINSRIIEKKQHLTVNIHQDVPRLVIGDDQRISQIITNLLSNATKFTPEDGQIYLGISLPGKTDDVCEIQVEVTDSGIGISPEQQAALFQPFMQADSGITREYGGTGLGLSIVKRLIEMMGGTIGVKSELGKGASFVFTIKLVQPASTLAVSDCPDNSLSSPDDSHMDDPMNDFTGKCLLLAEDIELNQEILVSLLEDTGITIDCVENGKEALTRIEREPEKYDIVFMDMQMPVMDGLEAARCIRALPSDRFRQIPIIAMTANVFKTDVEQCISAGMNDHIGKPIDLNLVMEKLRKYLQV